LENTSLEIHFEDTTCAHVADSDMKAGRV